jgi:hypothetical protein
MQWQPPLCPSHSQHGAGLRSHHAANYFVPSRSARGGLRGGAGLGNDVHSRRRPGLGDGRRLHRLGQRQDVLGWRQAR